MSKINILGAMCCILMMGALAGCTTINPQGDFETSRNAQQLVLAQTLEALWERAHVIPELQKGAPLTSSTESGQSAITHQNAQNLKIAQEQLSLVDERLAQRQLNPSTGDLAQLHILVATSEKQIQYYASPLAIYRGQQTRWPFVAEDGGTIDLRVVWNEDGNLYVEGQDVMDLSPASSDVPFATQVFYYGNQVLAQVSLNVVLQVKVPRL
ncbi:hypothetical protein ACFQ45_08215 [Rhodanobacter aciditrophus]|uniref:Lipoprotein n=1 Tax=Rhodanobacter aciditrophus TaxID=1623218 RepID=A0ABW4AZN6_9GAMM